LITGTNEDADFNFLLETIPVVETSPVEEIEEMILVEEVFPLEELNSHVPILP